MRNFVLYLFLVWCRGSYITAILAFSSLLPRPFSLLTFFYPCKRGNMKETHKNTFTTQKKFPCYCCFFHKSEQYYQGLSSPSPSSSKNDLESKNDFFLLDILVYLFFVYFVWENWDHHDHPIDEETWFSHMAAQKKKIKRRKKNDKNDVLWEIDKGLTEQGIHTNRQEKNE